jgi:predicted SAM-dependent methyltransferase
LKNLLLKKIKKGLVNRQSPKLDRNFIASQYITGIGIEIGALHNPLPVNTRNAKVQYVDRMGIKKLKEQYPELNEQKLVPVDIIANGELLESIDNSTQDFVIANHFIEHCQNPILTIKNMLRVLKKGGIIFLAVPDKRFTFDELRPVTTIKHLLEDFEKGTQFSKENHFREWSELVYKIQTEEQINLMTKKLIEMDYSIHFHVWEKKDMDEFLVFLIKNMEFGFEVEVSLRVNNSNENIYILRKLTN